MKIAIKANGTLEIERGGKMKKQYCPFLTNSTVMTECGDWCPMFRETEEDGLGGIVVEICRASFDVPKSNFIDERGK